MSERFDKLYELPYELYSVGSPVVVLAGALLRDRTTGKALVQLKFQSISDIPIKAIKIDISVFDVSEKEIEGVKEYQYLDLHIAEGQEFGSNKAIILPNTVARSFNVSKMTVVLMDGDIISVAMPLGKLPDTVDLKSLNNQELVKQYQLEIGMPVKYVPQESNGIWRCTCGIWNKGEKCSHCRAYKDIVFSAYDYSELTEKMNIRLAHEKVEAEERAERNRIKSEKNRNRSKKIAIISAAICSIIALYMVVTQWIYPSFIIPSGIYSNAEQLLEEGQYADAEEMFISIGEYKDALDRAEEAKIAQLDIAYNKAINLYDEEYYEKAIVEFEKLNGYRDSKEKIAEIEEIILSIKYDDAVHLLSERKYDEAYSAFQSIWNYKDASVMMLEVRHLQANEMVEKGEYYNAARIFYSLSDYGYKDSWEKCFDNWGLIAYRNSIVANDNKVACVHADGSISIDGWVNEGMKDALSWSDITSIAMGDWHIVGLKSDGTVVAESPRSDGTHVGSWVNIVQIAAGKDHTVGLKADGTVVATGENVNGQCNTSDWSNITMIAVGENHTVGLKQDGTVIAVGDNSEEQCEVANWKDIIAICANKCHTIGLRADGTVVTTKNVGSDVLCNNHSYNCEKWTNIVAIYSHNDNTNIIGVKTDGSVVKTGDASYSVVNLNNAVDIGLGSGYALAVRQDGKIAISGALGNDNYESVSDWENILVQERPKVEFEEAEPVEERAETSTTTKSGRTNVSGYGSFING